MRPLPFSNITLLITFIFAILMIIIGTREAYILFSVLLALLYVIQVVAFIKKRNAKTHKS